MHASDPVRENGYLVMTEVLNADMVHDSNARAKIDDDDNDFCLDLNKNISQWTNTASSRVLWGYPDPKECIIVQLRKNTHGRYLVEEHADMYWSRIKHWRNGSSCKRTTIPMAKGKKAGDEMWIARYILYRLTEDHNYYIEYPKPIKGDWNGSGMHANSLIRF